MRLRSSETSRTRPEFHQQGIWAVVTSPETAVLPPVDETIERAVSRLAELLSPALAEYVLRPASIRLGRPLIDAAAVKKSLLLNRFTRHVQLECARVLAGAGIETVYLKGFANAHTLYTDPDVRTVGDVDVLVRNDDLDRVIQLLSSRGFRFRGAAERSWGFISTASYVPFVSADGACNLDIHIQPDAYPVYRSLTADDMFAASRETNADTLPFRVPCAEHNLILSASNAAKDKFGPFCARKLVDAIVLLQTESHIDWSQIEVIARNGRFLRPVQVFLALLRRLGAPVTAASSGLDLSSKGLVAAEFERTFRDCRDLFPHTPGVLALLRRELLVCTEPSVGLYNSWLRLRGLVRPQSGIPPGARDLMQSST